MNGTYEPPRKFVDDLPPEVTEAIRWLLEPDREKRMGSCSELFDLLFEETTAVGRLTQAQAPKLPIQLSSSPPTTEEQPPPPRDRGLMDEVTAIKRPVRPPLPAGRPPQSHRMVPGLTRSGPGGHTAEFPEEQPQGRSFWLPAIIVLVALFGVAIGIAWNSYRTPETTGSLREPIELSDLPLTSSPRLDLEPEPAPQLDVPPLVEEPPPLPPRPRPRPAPASPPEVVAGATVEVAGDAKEVWLVSGDRRIAPGADIPTGTYRVLADFGSGEPTNAGTVTVRDGEDVTLECSSFLFRCQPKR